MTRQEKIEAQTIICTKCGCNEEQRKRHLRLFVDEDWQVHASKRFKQWWYQQPEYKVSLEKDEDGIGILPHIAMNVKRIWEAYLEAKEVGIAETEPEEVGALVGL